MQNPTKEDIVFHLVAGVLPDEPKQRVLYGVSRVAESVVRTNQPPPIPGNWRMAEEYFRIRLEKFSKSEILLPLREIESRAEELIMGELNRRPKYYPFSSYGSGFRVAQGIYLAKLTQALAEVFAEAINFTATAHGTQNSKLKEIERFIEGERATAERKFFRRNPALRAAAILKHGTACFGCRKTMEEIYGEIGKDLIEVHHLDPLSERTDISNHETKVTTVEDVVPLCPNCHRIVHRRKPALSLEELRGVISDNS